MKIRKLKSFQKAYLKVPKSIRLKFKLRLKNLVNGDNLKILKPHKLHGRLGSLLSFSVTGDYRCIYKKENDLIVLIDIGRHSKVYK